MRKKRRRWRKRGDDERRGGGVGGQRSSSQEMKVYVRVAPPLCLLNNSMLFPRWRLTYFATFFLSLSHSWKLRRLKLLIVSFFVYFFRRIFFLLRLSIRPCLFAYFLPFVIDVHPSLFHTHSPHAARSRAPSLPDIISCSL